MGRLKYGLALTGLALAGTLAATSATAQDRPQLGNAGNISGIPVDLLPPGARALGLAGAFGGVADDATAAVANPAGLTILSASELSVHYRDSDFNIDFLDPDAYNSGLFANAGALTKQYDDSGSDISFASFVKPFDRFTLSAYYLNQVSLNAAAPVEVVFDSDFIDTYTNINTLAADVEGWGASIGFRVNDLISIGLSVQRTELELSAFDFWQVEDFFDAEFDLFNIACATPDLSDACTSPEAFGMAITDLRGFGTELIGDDTDTTFNAGILINPNGRWSFGLVYRQGGEFDFNPNAVTRAQLGCSGSGAEADLCNDVLSPIFQNTETRMPIGPTKVGLPDTLTLGIAWRPTDTLLISLDINDIGYSDLPPPRPITQGFNLDVNDAGFRATMNNPGVVGSGPVTEPIGDETTFHLGIEKVFPLSGDFLKMYTLTLRGGAFTDPDHDGNALVDSDDTHGVFGIGATFGDHLQMDVASEFSDRVDNIVLSAIYRF